MPACAAVASHMAVAVAAAVRAAARIAVLLGLGIRAAENHKRRIHQKLAVSSQGHLAARAVTLGLAGRPAPGSAWTRPTLEVGNSHSRRPALGITE
jgi:hypothetical protein